MKLSLPTTVFGNGFATAPGTAEHLVAWNQMLTVSVVVELPEVLVVGEKPTSPVTTAQLKAPIPTTSFVGVVEECTAGFCADAAPEKVTIAEMATTRAAPPTNRERLCMTFPLIGMNVIWRRSG
jgi:hypothetical protein